MHPIIQKTFGGLSGQYLFRQYLFSIGLAALFIYMANSGAQQHGHTVTAGTMLWFIINMLLYPYSRFVYERVVGFVMGNNVFFVNAVFMMIAKIFTMMVCWMCAIFIAPLGLAYLYFHHSKATS